MPEKREENRTNVCNKKNRKLDKNVCRNNSKALVVKVSTARMCKKEGSRN